MLFLALPAYEHQPLMLALGNSINRPREYTRVRLRLRLNRTLEVADLAVVLLGIIVTLQESLS
jgi:hypothetical protein